MNVLNTIYFALLSVMRPFLDTTTTFTGLGGSFQTDGSTLMNNFVTVVGTLGQFLGAGLVVVGGWQFVHAMQESDGQGKSKAVLFIVAGIAAFSLTTILKMFLTNGG